MRSRIKKGRIEIMNKIIYWVVTGLLSAMMLMGAGMYIFNYEMVSEVFSSLGYPTYLVYPLATAKVLGIIAILTRKSEFLKNLAYAGFFYDFILAISAHINVNDGEFVPSAVALVLLVSSYIFGKKAFAPK